MTQNNISYVFSDSSLGHYAESIGGIAAPADYSCIGNSTHGTSTESWEESNLGMDLVMMEDPEHMLGLQIPLNAILIPKKTIMMIMTTKMTTMKMVNILMMATIILVTMMTI